MSKSSWDRLLIFLILAIGSISLLIIFSIDKSLAFNQLIFWLVGLLTLFFVSYIDFRIWQSFSKSLYFFALVALIILLIIGDPVRGSVRWIDLGAFRFQPSEIAKIASILTLANFFKDRQAKITNVLLSFIIIAPLAALVLTEPDIGNSLAFFAVWFSIIFACGFKFKQILGLSTAALVLIFFVFQILAPYQKQRVMSFINPSMDPLGTGYQVIQSKLAVGSGKFFGRGLGQGTQSQLNFLPESESDFIFASIAEQLGLVGSGLMIVLYSIFIRHILTLSKICSDRFPQLVIVGTSGYLLLQFLVNVGMNIGIIPVTGITFPLVSYGGSSLVTTLFLLGIIMAIKRQTFEA